MEATLSRIISKLDSLLNLRIRDEPKEERRGDQERITDQSFINWARNLLGDESGANNISYSTINLEKSKNGNFYPIPISQKEL